jgi:Xaa-Pro dipeptidase
LTISSPEHVTQTWDDARLRAERLTQLQAHMRQFGIGAMFLSGVNLRYALNLRLPGANVFVPAQGDPTAFVRRRDIPWVSKHVPTQKLLYEGTSMWDPRGTVSLDALSAGISDLMTEHGVGGEPLAVDTVETAAILALLNAGIRVVDATSAIEQARTVKTDDEIQVYRAIGALYTTAIGELRDAIRVGVSENELAGILSLAWLHAGGEDATHVELCSGPRMNPWNRWPSQRPLEPGDLVAVDFHGIGPCGLRGDVSRTFLVGDRPTAQQHDLYRRAHDYLRATIAVMRPGRSFQEVWDARPRAPDSFERAMNPYPVFHTIGMTPAGYPGLDRDRPAPAGVLRRNQVYAVECYFGEEGSPLAVKLEDQVRITDGEAEVLGSTIPFDENLM